MNAEDEIRDKFGTIWPAHVSSLTQLMIACRRSFDGDLDMFLVMCVIGDRSFSARKVDPGMDYDGFRNASVTPPEDINIKSISDFSGIPRETVRRKVAQLADKGWVSRNAEGFVVATHQAKADLEPLTLASIKYVARMMQLFRSVLQETVEKQ